MIHIMKNKPITTILFTVLILATSFFVKDKLVANKTSFSHSSRIIDVSSNDVIDILGNNYSEYPGVDRLY